MLDLLSDARSGGYAVCYCESWNLESLQAVVEAAEEASSPIIAGFNGGFLRHASRTRPERLAYYGAFSAALQATSVPVAFILNETDDFAQIEEGLDLGFNAVMVEGDHLEPKDYQQLVKKVVRLAHSRKMCIEAQLGRLPHGSEEGHAAGHITDARRVKAFAEETGIDALGVSIGNVHILTRGKAAIDMACLAEIGKQVDLPLVIHGGTGFPREYARQVIDLGVAKFNFGTNLKQAYLTALSKKLAHYAEPMNPHPFLGMGGREDILVAAREAVKDKVIELIRTYGFSEGRCASKRAKALPGQV
jgi:fructose-bisphosphate aldolase class II